MFAVGVSIHSKSII